MGNDADQITVGANGRVKVAPVGTTAPATIAAAASATWVDLGYCDDDGVTFTDGKTVTPIDVWQSFYPARQIVTGKVASAAFNLRQWNGDTVALAFGGGGVTEDAPGEYRYTPPDPGTIDERAMLIEWEDGAKNYRLILPRGMVTDDVETQLTKADAADLPITFGILGTAGVPPWYIQTNDPAMAPAGSS